jgi:hypothetical protein
MAVRGFVFDQQSTVDDSAVAWSRSPRCTPVHFDAPLIVISPSAGESNPGDQRYWLNTTSRASQVVLQGGTELINSEADRIAEEILSLAKR